jgi:hypothetical protein
MSIHRRVGKRGNTYEVRLRAPDGREISRSFRTEREARAFEAEQRTAMNRGGWIDPKAATTPFRALAERWRHSQPGQAAIHDGAGRRDSPAAPHPGTGR